MKDMEVTHAVVEAVATLTAEVEEEDIKGVEAGIAVEAEGEVTEVTDISENTHTRSHTHTILLWSIIQSYRCSILFFRQDFKTTLPSVKLIFIIRL